MSQTQVQLVGNVVTGAVFAGIVTANTALNVSDNVGLNSSGINVTGVVTATSFVGDGSGLTGVGIGTEGSINTTGIITASTISANEFIGTGDKLIFNPSATSFSPISGSTDISLSPTISITFDQPIYAGVGSIFLRNSSGIGTVIEAIGIGSTTQVSISNQTLTITPSILPNITSVYVVLPQGVITNAVAGNNALIDTYNFTTVDFEFSSVNPSIGATNVGIDTSITLSFTSPPSRGTGTIELKSGSVGGTLIESFDAAASGQISIAGNDWTLTPSSPLGYSTSIHPIIPNGAITGYAGVNTVGAALTYSFETEGLPALGSAFEGGYLICNAGGTAWVVASNTTEVSRNWYSRGDATTTANASAACGDWFVPSSCQLRNPGYICRTYWDSYSSDLYWSNTQQGVGFSFWVSFANGNYSTYNGGPATQTCLHCVRAFRCVSY